MFVNHSEENIRKSVQIAHQNSKMNSIPITNSDFLNWIWPSSRCLPANLSANWDCSSKIINVRASTPNIWEISWKTGAEPGTLIEREKMDPSRFQRTFLSIFGLLDCRTADHSDCTYTYTGDIKFWMFDAKSISASAFGWPRYSIGVSGPSPFLCKIKTLDLRVNGVSYCFTQDMHSPRISFREKKSTNFSFFSFCGSKMMMNIGLCAGKKMIVI